MKNAPLQAGQDTDVATILTEAIEPALKLMRKVHGEAGGSVTDTPY